MFTSSLSSKTETKLVDQHHGLKLDTLQCHKLQNSAIYSRYSKDQLHYVIDAVQKGRELPTQFGLKRLIEKNRLRAAKKKLKNSNSIPELNPKAPEEICVKALRTEFRNKVQKNHMAEQPKLQQKSAAILKRKEHQRTRRNELVRLVNKYFKELQPHFGTRLHGYGRCPKVSRQQIKDYLKTLGIEAKLDPVVVRPLEQTDIRRERRGRNNRYTRIPRGVLTSNYPIIGPSPMGLNQIPPMIPMTQQMLENWKKAIVTPGYQQTGMVPLGIVNYGVNTLPVMGIPWFVNSLGAHEIPSLGVRKVPPQPVAQQQHTAPALKDEDFPSLL